MTQIWGSVNAHLIISNGNLTATATGADGYQPGYGSEGFNAGKLYWEQTVSGTGYTTHNSSVGVGNTSSSISDGQWIGIGTDTLGCYFHNVDGDIYYNGSVLFTITAFTQSALVSANGLVRIALDLDNALIYFSIGASGNWYGDGDTIADPATLSHGCAIQSGITAAPVVPAFNLSRIATPDTITAAFASASWVGTPPSGFGPFDPVDVLMGAMVM